MPAPTEGTLVDYCYRHLREAIIQGALAPGEKLKIAKLKARLDVGPTPIREALSRLTASGLIEVEANKGFRVKSASEAEVRDVYATFNKLEVMALYQAMELGDTAWEADILACLHKLSLLENARSAVDLHAWLHCNYAFHTALVSGCNSPCLLKVREDVYQLFERYCQLSFHINKDSLAFNHKAHRQLAKAVIARNKDKACGLLSEHLYSSLVQVLEVLKAHNII